MNDYVATEIAKVIKKVFDVELTPEVTRPEPQFGDAASNVALQLTKQVGKPPRGIAETIARKLRENKHIIEVSVAGPGFINIRVSDAFIASTLDAPLPANARADQTVVIETNNPNPFKDLHIGHAYNCIVADTVANLLEASGAETHRVSYHGDIGLHVGKSMWAILKFIDGDITKFETIETHERSQFMSRMYVEGSQAYQDDEAAKVRINELTKQSFVLDDPFYKEVYDICKVWSFAYIDGAIKRLGSQSVERRYLESEADIAGTATVHEHIGDVFIESDSAIIYDGSHEQLNTCVFISSRGTSLYAARDLGLMQLKQQEFHPQKSYIVTGGEQRDYFKTVIRAAEKALPELDEVTENISTGMVKLSTGKMSSRTGEVLNIEWLFEQLEVAAKTHSDEADPNVITGALRYTLLKVRVGSDVIFDVNESLSIEGNSGPYLQYAHARARSILAKKRGVSKTELNDTSFDEYERTLALKLTEYAEALSRATNELLPHHICTYLYELAQTFNRFYEHSRVLDDPREALRLQLALRYADTLRDGLHLLGIPAPERL